MSQNRIAMGAVHKVPAYLKAILISNLNIRNIWNAITPLARNEWICWIESAKKQETKERRMKIMRDKLTKGDHRPCCWAGCPHR